MHTKQNKNQFLAYKALYNRTLHNAIQSDNLQLVDSILQSEYQEETYHNFYVDCPIDLAAIKLHYAEFMDEINNNPDLLFIM